MTLEDKNPSTPIGQTTGHPKPPGAPKKPKGSSRLNPNKPNPAKNLSREFSQPPQGATSHSASALLAQYSKDSGNIVRKNNLASSSQLTDEKLEVIKSLCIGFQNYKEQQKETSVKMRLPSTPPELREDNLESYLGDLYQSKPQGSNFC